MRVVAPPPLRERTDAPEAASTMKGLVAVAVVAAAWVVLQVVLFGTGRFLGWDEAVYLAEVTPDVPALDFSAQRARGMVVVAAPVAWAGVSALRGYLVLVSGAALVAAFWPWARRLGPVAAVAAGLFAVTWGPLVLGSELYPNLLTGLAAVAAAGWLVEHLETRANRPLIGVAVGIAAVAMLRPSDSVWIAAALAVVTLLVHRRVAVAPFAALVVGGALGWTPWLIEAVVRFGGPIERLRAAAGLSMGGDDRNNVVQYLNLLEGPLKGVTTDPTVPVLGAVWLLGFAALVGVGLAQGRRPRWRAPTVSAFVAATALLVPYLTVTGGINIRYLLPAYALACVPAAVGLAVLCSLPGRRGAGRGVLRVLLIVVVAAWAGWQVALATANEEELAESREGLAELAAVVDERADGRPCAFASQYGYPSIHVASNCLGTRLMMEEPDLVMESTPFALDELASLGWGVYALGRGEPPENSPLHDWPDEPLDAAGNGWTLYEHPVSASRS